MDLSTMLEQLAGGMVTTAGNFLCDFDLFPATGASDMFWKNVKE